MRSMAGSKFDPVVMDAFNAAVKEGDISPPSSPPVQPVSMEAS